MKIARRCVERERYFLYVLIPRRLLAIDVLAYHRRYDPVYAFYWVAQQCVWWRESVFYMQFFE